MEILTDMSNPDPDNTRSQPPLETSTHQAQLCQTENILAKGTDDHKKCAIEDLSALINSDISIGKIQSNCPSFEISITD